MLAHGVHGVNQFRKSQDASHDHSSGLKWPGNLNVVPQLAKLESMQTPAWHQGFAVVPAVTDIRRSGQPRGNQRLSISPRDH